VMLAVDGEPASISRRGGRWRRLGCRRAIWRLRGAQEGRDEAGGGPVQADITEVLGGGRRSLVGGERREGGGSLAAVEEEEGNMSQCGHYAG
jgi:hypothetical protein